MRILLSKCLLNEDKLKFYGTSLTAIQLCESEKRQSVPVPFIAS